MCVAVLVLGGLTPIDATSQIMSLLGGTARAGSSEHVGSRQGRLFGARLTFSLDGWLGLRLGPDYVERNLPELFAASPVPAQLETRTYESSYLEVPVLFKASLFSSARVSPHVLLGPAVGFHLRCQLLTDSFSTNALGQAQFLGRSEVSCENDLIGRSVKRLQLDARVGVGVDIRLPARWVGALEIVYGVGAIKIFDLFAAKPRVTMIRVGIGMPLN